MRCLSVIIRPVQVGSSPVRNNILSVPLRKCFEILKSAQNTHDHAVEKTFFRIFVQFRVISVTDITGTDGLEKFCEGGEKLESWGGITDVQFVKISDASYSNRYGTEEYLITYTFQFDGKEEGFGISLTKDGIDSIGSGDGLIRHPLSHLTLWVQWMVDDYMGKYYDFDLGTWVDVEKGN